MSDNGEDFTGLLDLASRDLGGSVVFANDELFAEKENLIKPGAAVFAADFGNKGKVYDGWETRRRREPGHDHAIVRLGCSGIVHGVVVDTAFFRGNYPPEISVEAVCADGYPSPAELAGLHWHPLVERSAAAGDSANAYPVPDRRRWTHVRLSIYPDGGVARLRVHGEVVPDPVFMTSTVDLAAAENGGRVAGCSDAFYSSPWHLIMPGRARVMSDGWENARRRGPGNDYVVLELGAPGRIRHVEIDTSYFVGNAPGWVRLSAAAEVAEAGSAGSEHGGAVLGGVGSAGSERGGAVLGGVGSAGSEHGSAGPGGARSAGRWPDGAGSAGVGWREILPETRVQPDTRHRFRIDDAAVAGLVRLDVIPDGGMARLRVFGEVTAEALTALRERWRSTTP